VLDDIKGQVVFVGELSVAMARAAANPRRVRWADAWLVAEKAGVNAVPIASLIGFIVGLVIAFQSAIPMQQFGVEIYVADLIGLGMLRELGPLMTAIVLVSRSGSAFAAEIGTMKVNQEIDALTTMGLDPVRFLVVPRVIGISAMTPFVTIIATLAGILGGMIVIVSFGYPVVTYFNHVLDSVDLVDFTGGVFKAWVLGVLVGAVGCLRGLQTESGAGAVGDAATSAVVSGIVLITVVDGVFAVAFYYLGI
jgi:phospholipid/cholesterol/gamma-HCH transport system permease protein